MCRIRFSVLLFLATVTTVSANPVDVEGQLLAIPFAIIGIGCLIVEVSLLRILCRISHNTDCDLGMTIAFVALNVVTWFVLLAPVYEMTGSVLMAELVVVAAETIGISRILAYNSIIISAKRAIGYALSLNLISFLIGLALQ